MHSANLRPTEKKEKRGLSGMLGANRHGKKKKKRDKQEGKPLWGKKDF